MIQSRKPAKALFNGVDRHCGAPFVRKRALLLFVGAFAPFSSLRSSMHPESAFADSLERFSDNYVPLG
jgi:hypothetical protein